MKRKPSSAKSPTLAFFLGAISCYFGANIYSEFFTRPTLVQAPSIRCSIGFSPQGPCTKMIINEIKSAKSEILVQAYHLTSNPIVNALIQAKNRGVEVIAIFDKVMLQNKILNDLKKSKIHVLIDSKVAIAHNKVIVIDSRKVITGSFNFTNAAQFKNAENLLVLDSPEIANIFRNNWIQRSFVSKHL